jgi:hypothetical protein
VADEAKKPGFCYLAKVQYVIKFSIPAEMLAQGKQLYAQDCGA